MAAALNVSAYCFVAIDEPSALRESLLARASTAQLKGTILVAEEGINLFLAGPAPVLRGFIDELRCDPRFAGLHARESWSAAPPFGKLRVKVKREIIRMNRPTVRPQDGRAPALGASTLRRWLDQGHDDSGRPLLMLDTRNAFEVEHGRFEGATHWNLAKFSDFPAALATHGAELEGKTVVSYCTGGIRCEKAALLMREAGLPKVWQLEGGILQYLEETGGAHWHGDCFVFDERETLGPDLAPARP